MNRSLDGHSRVEVGKSITRAGRDDRFARFSD
jgi:hypothetical protein